MTTAAALRTVRLPSRALFAIHQTASRDQPPIEAATFLRQVGYDMGDGFAASFKEWLGQTEPATGLGSVGSDHFWQLFTRFWEENLGWGTLQHVALHPGVAALDSADWMEADTEGATGCHLTTGILAELLRSIAAADVAVLEAECRCRGDSRCRFLFGSPAALNRFYANVQTGFSYPEALQRLG